LTAHGRAHARALQGTGPEEGRERKTFRFLEKSFPWQPQRSGAEPLQRERVTAGQENRFSFRFSGI